MSRYILDTDHITLLQRVHPQVTQRVGAIAPNEIGIAIVTIEEQVRGWLNAIRQASSNSQPERLIWAYVGLRDVVQYLNRFAIADFNLEAYNCYLSLRRQKIRIGTQDLKIASIALACNSILVTRNQRDFANVPGLVLEDWTLE